LAISRAIALRKTGSKDGVKKTGSQKDGVKSCKDTLFCYNFFMSRPLRIELSGGLHHVTSRGDRREDIYFSDTDREAWLALLGQA